MRRFAIISDLHAHTVALDAVFEDAASLGVEQFFCLGDIVDLGPEPRETVQRLVDRKIPCVKGNHDGLDEHPGLPLLQEIEDFTRVALGAEGARYLAELPVLLDFEWEGLRIVMSHGSVHSFYDSLLGSTPDVELEAFGGGRVFDLFAAGHTHLPLVRDCRGRKYVNPGSLGLPFFEPFSGAPPRVFRAADYAVVSVHRSPQGPAVGVELRRVPYDFSAYEAALRRSGFPDPKTWLAQFI